MYGVDPSQRLRLLRRRLTQITDGEFRAELLQIFVRLPDLHTNCVLARPYQSPFAFLGLMLRTPGARHDGAYDAVSAPPAVEPFCA